MFKRKFGTGVLVMTLLFALAFSACDTGSGVGGGGGGTNPALNGVWGIWDEGRFFPVFMFDNGVVEAFNFRCDCHWQWGAAQRGIFTTSENNLTVVVRYLHSEFMFIYELGFERNRWIPIVEVRSRAATAGYWEFVSDIDRFFLQPQSFPFFISGNTLMLIGENLIGEGVLTRL